MLYSSVCQACFLITLKLLLALEIDTTTILIIRSSLGLIIFVPWMIKKKFFFPKSNLKIHFIRSGAFLIGGFALLISLNTLPMTTVIMITYTSPMLVCLAAVIIFKEKITAYHIIALLLNFVGVNMLFTGEILVDTIGIISALVATLMITIAQISLKCLSQTENKTDIFVTQLLFTLPVLIALYFIFGELPSMEHLPSFNHLPLLIIMTFSFVLGQLFLINALSKSELNKLMPLDSVRLILVAASGLLLFDESISLYLVIGSALILIATLITFKPALKLNTK
uniref:Membrane protein, putative n=1 Tax=Colwellia sp. C1 TaxID=1737566 RepID=A0A0P0KTA8_9GAMM|nr:membrane protein, putative [Colwellia sp. C1]